MDTDGSAHRFNQFLGIVSNAVFENQLDVLNVFDALRGIAVEYDDVGGFAGSKQTG